MIENKLNPLPTFLGLLLLLSVLSSCGPVYNTQYDYYPPENPSGRACIFQCENGKLQCEQLEDMRKENCESRAERQYERCRDRDENNCYRSYCSSDYKRCEKSYRTCYQSCGGKIQESQVCVAFCE